MDGHEAAGRPDRQRCDLHVTPAEAAGVCIA
jgi:hypothetical protein